LHKALEQAEVLFILERAAWRGRTHKFAFDPLQRADIDRNLRTVTQSDPPTVFPRPRRAVGGALLGGMAGLVATALASPKVKSESLVNGAALGALAGAALGALAPVPLSEALEVAATSLGLTLVSVRRTGETAASALVEASDGYHTVKFEARRAESREAIDDELYSGMVQGMKSLACPT